MVDQWPITRRTALKGFGGIAGLSLSNAAVSKQVSATTTNSRENYAPDFGGDDHLYPHILAWGANAVFLRSKGFEETTHDQRKKGVLSTHPEAFWAYGVTGFDGPPSETGTVSSRIRGELELALDLGFKTPLGRPGLFSFYQEKEWYEGLEKKEKWRLPDGSILDSHMDASIRYPDGERVKLDMDECDGDVDDCEDFDVVPSLHVDGVRNFYNQIAVDYVDMGTFGIWIDQLDVQGRQRDFSPWAQEAFREHLQELSNAELERLGIEDPDGLEVVEEILNRSPPDTDAHPAEDPLYREYTTFDFQSKKDFLVGIRDYLANEYPDRNPDEFLIFGNLYGPFENPHSAAILSDPLTLPVGESQETISANNVFDFNVKFYVAAGRFEKSGFHQGRSFLFDEDRIGEVNKLDMEEPQTDFCSIQFAEQIANRAIGVATFQGDCCYGPIQEQPGNWMHPDGSIPDELQELTGFAWSTRELLRGGEFEHDVAVVRSLPTTLWEAGTWEWDRSNKPINESFGGAANVVMETDRPYDVLIFGHPDLWDDEEMLDRLSTYEQVILPSVRAISDAQRASLLEALNEGLHVIFSDEIPSRNADYEPLSDGEIDELVNHQNSTVLSGTPARDHWNGNGEGEPLKEALTDRPRLVSTNVNTNLELTLQAHTSPERLVLQVVNYDINLDSGDVSRQSDVSITIRDDLTASVEDAKYYRPGKAPTTLEIEQENGRIGVTLPELDVWGVLVFGKDSQAVSLSGEKGPAAESIDTAKAEIAAAESEGRTEGIDDARQFESYAETGMHYGAYERANTAAKKASETAKAAIHVPVIGIDNAHNQPAVEKGFDSLVPFQENFIRDVEFVAVDEWNEETFEELDILMVRPTQSFEDHNFGFTEAEAKLAGDFVNSGGGLLFIGSHGVPDDYRLLLDQFDVGFKSGTIKNPDGYGSHFAPRRETHVINQTTPTIGGTGPSYAIDPPDEATVLYEYPTGEGIWRSNCESTADEPCGPDAGGEPLSALFTHGNGTVMVHASDKKIGSNTVGDDFTEPWDPTLNIVRNAIHYMTRGPETGGSSDLSTTSPDPTSKTKSSTERTGNLNQTTESSAPTTNPDPTSETKSSTERTGNLNQTTESSAPGFGLLSSVTTLMGGVYVLKRHLEKSNDSK